MMIEIATRMATYNKTKYVMRNAVGRTELCPRAVRVLHDGRTAQVVSGHKFGTAAYFAKAIIRMITLHIHGDIGKADVRH